MSSRKESIKSLIRSSLLVLINQVSDGQILEEVSKPLHVKDLAAQARVLRAENND